MARNDLILRIGADDSPLRASLKRLSNDMARTADKLESIGQSLSLRLSAPLAGAAAASVAAFAQFDKLEKGLTAVTGSASEAERQLSELRDITADTRTSLDLQNAAKAALQLQGVGVSAEQATSAIRALGIAATLSGASADDVGEVARQFAQATAKGVIMQEELSVALERLPALAAVINREFGTVTAEGLREAGVSASEFVERLVGAIEADEKFQNVQGGLSKSFETFSTNVQIAGAELGKAISETVNLEGALNTISETIGRVVSGFSALSPQTKTLVIGAGALTAAIGPLSLAVGSLLKTIPLLTAGFTALLSPVALVGAAIGALGIAIVSEYTAADAATVAQNRLNKAITEAKAAIDRESQAVSELTDRIQSETTTRGEKARAIEQLKRISPEYFGQLDVERLKTEDLTKAVDDYNKSLRRVTLQKLNQESLEAQLELEKVNKELEIANATIEQTAGQFGSYAGVGVRRTVGLLERRRDELMAAISALADATAAEVDNLNIQFRNEVSTDTEPTKADPVTIPAKVEVTGAEEVEKVKDSLSLLPVEPLEAVNDAFSRFDEFVQGSTPVNLIEGFTAVGDAVGTAKAKIEEMTAAQERLRAVQQVANAAFQSAAAEQIKTFGDIGRAALAASAKVVKAKIQEATVNFIADAFAKFGVFGAIAAAGAGALVGGVVSKAFSALNIPALAEGGITTGPTLALIGEGRENEVVLPLSKLDNLINNSQPKEQLIASVGIDQLYVALKRYEFENGRVN